MRYEGYVKCFNTMTGTYENVDVSVEVEEFLKRSYWRESMQSRRYNNRVLELREILYSQSQVWESEVSSKVIFEEVKETLLDAVSNLSERHQYIVRRLYFEKAKQKTVADELGVSISYVSRLNKLILEKLKDDIQLKAVGF